MCKKVVLGPHVSCLAHFGARFRDLRHFLYFLGRVSEQNDGFGTQNRRFLTSYKPESGANVVLLILGGISVRKPGQISILFSHLGAEVGSQHRFVHFRGAPKWA